MRILAGIGLFALIATSQVASAQVPNPAAGCAKMKDAVGCACAAVTGGMVSATSWARGQDRLRLRSLPRSPGR